MSKARILYNVYLCYVSQNIWWKRCESSTKNCKWWGFLQWLLDRSHEYRMIWIKNYYFWLH